jgi:putative transposase
MVAVATAPSFGCSNGKPQFLIVDGAPGLEKALAAVWEGVSLQRCTVHKHRNLLAHAPERLHDEVTADYTDMIYAATPKEIETRRKAFIRKWRLRHRASPRLEISAQRLTSNCCAPIPMSRTSDRSRWMPSGALKACGVLQRRLRRDLEPEMSLPWVDGRK